MSDNVGSDLSAVALMLEAFPQAPSQVARRGAWAFELAAFQGVYDISLPGELKEWLLLRNGVLLQTITLYGIDSNDSRTDMGLILDVHPDWNRSRRFPVAGDDFGNHYVLDDSRPWPGALRPVSFFDHESNEDEPQYAVASGLTAFLEFIVEEELAATEARRGRWPFDRDFVLERDPDLELLLGVLRLPWE